MNTIHSSQSDTQNDNHETPLLFLDKKMFVGIKRGKLPHWSQQNRVQFITFRLADSLPQSKLEELSSLKQDWLDTHPLPWDQDMVDEYERFVLTKVNKWLDAGFGSCVLSRPEIRKIIFDALIFYDGSRYRLWAFVVMPNHVHLLVSPMDGDNMNKIIGNIKRYTSININKAINSKGNLWQKEVFDRIVRSGEHFERIITYIKNNPRGLRNDSFSLYVSDNIPGRKSEKTD